MSVQATDPSASGGRVLTISDKADVYALINDGTIAGRKDRLLVFAVLGSVFLDAYDFIAVGATTKSLTSTFHLTPGQLGALTSSIAVGALCGALFCGPLLDRIGRLKLFMLDMVFFVVAALVAAFAPNIWIFLLARFIMGIGVGIDVPAAYSFLAEYSSVKNKRATMNRYLMYWYYATILAFLLALMFDRLGAGQDLWRYLVGLGALPAVGLIMLRYAYMDESPFWAASRGDLHGAAAIIRKMYGVDLVVDEKSASGTAPAVKLGLATMFSRPYAGRTASVALVNFLQALVYFGVAFYLPVVATILFGHNPTLGLLGAAGFQIFGLIGSTLSSRTVSFVGLRRQAMIGFGAECIVLLVLGLWSAHMAVLAAASLVAIFMLAHTFGPGQNGMALAALSYPTEIRGLGTAFGQTMNRIGSIGGLFFFPVVLGALGLAHTLLVIAIAPAAAVIALTFLRWDPIGHEADVVVGTMTSEPAVRLQPVRGV